MKKMILVLVTVLMMIACGTKQAINYTVECSREGLGGEITMFIDTTKSVTTAEDGVARFEGLIEEPRFAYILDANDEPIAQFVVEPGEIIVDEVGVHGTPSNDVIMNLNKRLSKLVNEFYASQSNDEQRNADFTTELQFVIDSTYNANVDNFACVAMLNILMQNMGPEEVLTYIGKMSPEMQQHTYIRELSKLLKGIDLGDEYIDFEAPKLNEETGLAVSSLLAEGKYVLLDFWASWCGPCMGEVPYLQKAYKKFGGEKFEIVGFSLDEDGAAWAKAAASMPWLHLSDGLGWASPVARLYNVKSIPTNFLIAPDGIVVEKNLRGEALEQAIAKYIK